MAVVEDHMHGLEHNNFLKIISVLLVTKLEKAKKNMSPPPVVQSVDNAIYRINHYPADKC